MTWVRLADDFYDHPKVIEAGPLAVLLWICGIAYANRYLTDGYLPAGAVRRLADVEDPYRLAARLVDVRLWDAADGGYRIHDYASYQPSAESVREERTKNAERVAEWRERQRNARSNDVRNGVGDVISPASPGPTPYSYLNPAGNPASSTTPLPPPPHAEEGARNPRRRRTPGGSAAPPPEVPETLAPPTDADLRLWQVALARASDDMTPANEAQLCRLEPLGRGPDGGLRLRAPPGQLAARFQGVLAAALFWAGDQAAEHVAIVEG